MLATTYIRPSYRCMISDWRTWRASKLKLVNERYLSYSTDDNAAECLTTSPLKLRRYNAIFFYRNSTIIKFQLFNNKAPHDQLHIETSSSQYDSDLWKTFFLKTDHQLHKWGEIISPCEDEMSLCSGFMCWNNADTRTDPRRHFEHNGAPCSGRANIMTLAWTKSRDIRLVHVYGKATEQRQSTWDP